MIKTLAQIGFPAEVGNVVFPATNARFTDLLTFAQVFLPWILTFAGVLAAAAIVYSGLMYISAGGDAEQATKAKKNLTWSIIGIVLVVLSATLVTWVNTILNSAHP